MDWFRSYHGAPTDPKWLSIARRAKVLPGQVASVVWAMFDHASQNEADRGSVAGFDAEAIADFFGYEPEQVEAIVGALTDKGIISEGRFTAWDKRQPKREDATAADRKRAQREREKSAKPDGGEQGQGGAHDDEASRSVTPGHDVSRNVTLDKRRVEEIRDPIPPPTETSRPAGEPKPVDRSMAAAVARHFIEQREKHWSDTSRLPAPMTTITTQAQQHIDAGGTVELLNEIIDRGFATWAKPTPPQSLSAFGDSLTDRVAEFVRTGKQPAARASSPQHRRDTGPAEHIVVDMQSTLRQRLKTFRDRGEWFWPGEPRPDNPRCPIDRKLMREVMGDEFMARWHPQATPTHEAHHA